MSRTYHHRSFARDFMPRFVGHYTGYAYCNWGAEFKRFMKRTTHKSARKFYRMEVQSALREADSLEVALLTHRENVNAEPLHQAHSKYCLCAQCLQEFELDAENCAYADRCGDPYCEYCGYAPVCAHCGQYECEGACPESYNAEDAYYDRIYQQEITYYRGE